MELLNPDKAGSIPAQSYDALVMSGAFSPGHLNPTHIPELLRITKQGGLIVIAMRLQWYRGPIGEPYNWPYNMEKELHALQQAGKWTLMSKKEKDNYVSGKPGIYFVWKKC